MLWVLCLLLGLTIPMCRQIKNAPLARAAKAVATYSYGIYLTHLYAIGFGFFALAAMPLTMQWLAFFAALPILAHVAYRWIERPGIGMGVRLAEQMQKVPPARQGQGRKVQL